MISQIRADWGANVQIGWGVPPQARAPKADGRWAATQAAMRAAMTYLRQLGDSKVHIVNLHAHVSPTVGWQMSGTAPTATGRARRAARGRRASGHRRSCRAARADGGGHRGMDRQCGVTADAFINPRRQTMARETLSRPLRPDVRARGRLREFAERSRRADDIRHHHTTLAAARGWRRCLPPRSGLTLAEAEAIYRRSYWVQSGGDLLAGGAGLRGLRFRCQQRAGARREGAAEGAAHCRRRALRRADGGCGAVLSRRYPHADH